jgi:hypothetical protein
MCCRDLVDFQRVARIAHGGLLFVGRLQLAVAVDGEAPGRLPRRQPVRHGDGGRLLRLHQLEVERRAAARHFEQRRQQRRHHAVGAGQAAGVDHQHPVDGVDPDQRGAALGEGARQQVQQHLLLEFLLDLARHALVAGVLLVLFDALVHRRLDGGGGHGALFGAQLQQQVAAHQFGELLALLPRGGIQPVDSGWVGPQGMKRAFWRMGARASREGRTKSSAMRKKQALLNMKQGKYYAGSSPF